MSEKHRRQPESDVWVKQCLDVFRHLDRQLSSFWDTQAVRQEQMLAEIADAVRRTEKELEACNQIYPNNEGFSIFNTNAYAAFLYHLSHSIGSKGGAEHTRLADQIYYLNKIMNGVEWYWNIELPEHFLCEHPIGSVLGKAQYGDYLCVYQGVTVGANFRRETCIYLVLGDFVTLYANATVLGESRIGNQVVVAANAFVMNENIPDHCVVFGSSPNLTIRTYSEKEMQDKFMRIWKL